MDIIDALQKYRLEHGLSQEKIAKRLGVTFRTMSRWCNKHNRPSYIYEYRIKKLLNIHD